MSSGVLTPSWINPGGAAATTYLFHDSTYGDLEFTGDVSAVTSSSGDSVQAVEFVLKSASCLASTVTGKPSASTVSYGGPTVSDSVTVTGSTKPTGSVSFSVCGPLTGATGCATGGTALGSSVNLAAGTATSAAFGPPHVGTYCFRADYSGDNVYSTSSASSGKQCFTVTLAPQSISFGALPSPETVGAQQTLTAVGGSSGNAVTFTVDSATTNSSCAIESSALNFDHPGSCVVDAAQAGNSDYQAGTAQQTITVNKAAQTIAFAALPAHAVFGTQQALSATGGNSSNPVTFAIDAATTNSACSLSGTTLSFDHAGSCVVDAAQQGNADYAAGSAQQTVVVGQVTQVIAFSPLPTPAVVGQTQPLSATGGNSGHPVTFTIDPATTNSACNIDADTVSYQHAGTCVVDAAQQGNGDYTSASTQQSVTVNPADQDITLSGVATPVVVGGEQTLSATAGGSQNPVTFSVDPTTTNRACSLTGTANSTLTYEHVGECVIDAAQAGTADYNPAATQLTVEVDAGSQSITFVALSSPATPGHAQPLAATSTGSSNPVIFSVDSQTTNNACSIDGTQLSFAHAGSCVVNANKAGSADYLAAATSAQTVVVNVIPTSVSLAVTPGASVFGQGTTATATVTNDVPGTVQFSVDGLSTGDPVTVHNGVANAPSMATVAPGGHEIGARFIPADPSVYGTSNAPQQSLIVSAAPTTTTVAAGPHTIRATVTATAPGAGAPTGTVAFSVDGSVVDSGSLQRGVATVRYTVPAGETRQIAATYQGDADYLASSASTARNDPRIKATLTSAHPLSRFGWYRSAVTVTFTCATSGAPLRHPCPAPVIVRRNGAAQSIARTITATNGGSATAAVSGINIDHSAPTVSVGRVVPGGRYLVTGPAGRCVGRDPTSHIATCTVHRHRHAGLETYTAAATDRAGNRRTAELTVHLSDLVIRGARFSRGAYDLRSRQAYTLLVAAARQPDYLTSARYAQPSAGQGHFHKVGYHRWALRVTFAPSRHPSATRTVAIQVGTRRLTAPIRLTA